MDEVRIRNLTRNELLQYADRSDPVVKRLCEELEVVLDSFATLKRAYIEDAQAVDDDCKDLTDLGL